MSLDLLCLDADDTLWHNMRHFDAAETAFLTMMAPFADKSVARDQLEATSSANLRLYGYGAKSFTLSMIETATQLCGDALTTGTITAIDVTPVFSSIWN
jgi:putative hydrolase of the HAD superfamily